jgi:hypothetical protein
MTYSGGAVDAHRAGLTRVLKGEIRGFKWPAARTLLAANRKPSWLVLDAAAAAGADRRDGEPTAVGDLRRHD